MIAHFLDTAWIYLISFCVLSSGSCQTVTSNYLFKQLFQIAHVFYLPAVVDTKLMHIQVWHILGYVSKKLIFFQNFKALNVKTFPCSQVKLWYYSITAKFWEILLVEFLCNFICFK